MLKEMTRNGIKKEKEKEKKVMFKQVWEPLRSSKSSRFCCCCCRISWKFGNIVVHVGVGEGGTTTDLVPGADIMGTSMLSARPCDTSFQDSLDFFFMLN